MRPKARGLVHHGGPPGWLVEIDPAGCDFVRNGLSKVHAACLDGPHHLWEWFNTKCSQNTVMSSVTQGRQGLVLFETHAFSLVLEVGGWGGWRFGVWWRGGGEGGFTCQILDILSVREVKERRFKEALEKLPRFSKPNLERAEFCKQFVLWKSIHIYVRC